MKKYYGIEMPQNIQEDLESLDKQDIVVRADLPPLVRCNSISISRMLNFLFFAL